MKAKKDVTIFKRKDKKGIFSRDYQTPKIEARCRDNKNIPVYLPKIYSSSRSHQGVVMKMMMMMTIFSGESNCIINLPVVDGTATYSENIICNSASEKL